MAFPQVAVELKSTDIPRCCSAVGSGTKLEAGRQRVRFPMRSMDSSVDVILPAALCHWGRLSL
jgi:hypothetical protein